MGTQDPTSRVSVPCRVAEHDDCGVVVNGFRCECWCHEVPLAA